MEYHSFYVISFINLLFISENLGKQLQTYSMKFTRLVLIFFLFIGCEPMYTNKYIVRNETSHSINIQAYCRFGDADYLQKPERIYIAPHSSYTVVKQAGYHGDQEGIFVRYEIDSVSILFDSTKVMVQFCENDLLKFCEVERNIMNIESEYVAKKIGRSSGHNEYQFTYTITEGDYENATSIDN